MALPPNTVEVRLLLTNAQAAALALLMERGAFAASRLTDNESDRAEMEGAMWAAGRQFRAAGIRAGDADA